MATYTTKRCPYCGKSYERYSTYTKAYHDHTGSPFLKCSSCGKTFIDKEFKEPALDPHFQTETSIFQCFLGFLMPWGLGALFATWAAADTQATAAYVTAIVLYLIYFGLTFWLIASRQKTKAALERDYSESLKRLQNVEYARALADAGFDVPAKYLVDDDGFIPQASVKSAGQWLCSCGRIHEKYEFSCVCGKSKFDITDSITNDPQKEK